MYMPIKGARMRVLIIDDEPLSRNAVENAVGGRKDMESLDSAADAVEALEMLEKKSYGRSFTRYSNARTFGD